MYTVLVVVNCHTHTPHPPRGNVLFRVLARVLPLSITFTEMSSEKRFVCSICGSAYSHSSGLSRHKSRDHTQSFGNIACSYTECCCRFSNIDQLIKHLQESHNHSIEVKTRKFDTMEDFMAWKSDIEKSSSSSYVLHSAPQKREDHSCYYYYCNRSGVYHLRGKGKRALKLQGSSNKVDGYCVAYIRACRYTSGAVTVEICDHHLHESQLAHIPLPESTRHMIAAKLQDGVEIQAILDSIRDGVEGAEIGRSELINRQDIHNIRHQYNIEGIQYHSNDHSSVQLWVDNLQSDSEDESVVLLFKEQGVEQSNDLNDFSVSDFALGIQTCFQKDMLFRFGKESICIDSTHGTNIYDFYLITVLVLDDYKEGIPVAWLILNREDAAVLNQFFSKLKVRCGDISTDVFMSDDADNFFNGWKGVFTVSNTRKLICSWHVDRSWRKGLHTHISVKSKQAEVYHHL
ncbi:PREDICTED: uncharacterized protein LOC109582660 [Amphimedon queenslandica]|uniref:C2H2-type domain-containing protein n=1 Tax=Amphimedon queenslandica TaxID=400682 RepID=A0AAN0J7Q3_AMPQE|nr:PREDICTED: uncharacterized protein LOC109582660 [Amphimedon queenslandica]|eukprot:XP_019853060.1 PREDICTED: uncharacterized protein LOC109582660 [Amphimedon queenslandica]